MPAGQQVSEDLGSCLSPHAVCQLAPKGACKPASQSEPLLFAPPASPPIRRLQRSKSSHIIVSHWCRGEGCSPPPCAACQLAPEGACKPASQSEPLLFAPPASPPIRRLQRSKSSHIIVSHCCRGEGCSPPPCAACQLAPEGVCVSAKSERDRMARYRCASKKHHTRVSRSSPYGPSSVHLIAVVVVVSTVFKCVSLAPSTIVGR